MPDEASTITEGVKMDSQDFSKYSKGMDRMARFFPETWPRAILFLGIPAARAAWAYYNHLVLLLMLFALAFMGSVESCLLHGRRSADEELCLPAGDLAQALDYMHEVIHRVAQGQRSLLDAVNRIDPWALRSRDEADDEIARADLRDAEKGQRHWSGCESSVARLDREILKLQQEVGGLRGSHPA